MTKLKLKLKSFTGDAPENSVYLGPAVHKEKDLSVDVYRDLSDSSIIVAFSDKTYFTFKTIDCVNMALAIKEQLNNGEQPTQPKRRGRPPKQSLENSNQSLIENKHPNENSVV